MLMQVIDERKKNAAEGFEKSEKKRWVEKKIGQKQTNRSAN